MIIGRLVTAILIDLLLCILLLQTSLILSHNKASVSQVTWIRHSPGKQIQISQTDTPNDLPAAERPREISSSILFL